MKNSATNPSGIQVLQAQAKQLLPLLTVAFSKLNYSDISHQRISQQNNDNTTSYQGLTRAQHSQFGCIMIKWALHSTVDHHTSNHSTSGLSHEIVVLNILNKSKKDQSQNDIASILPLAPLVLAYDTLMLDVLNLSQQITMLVIPCYSQGSLAYQLSNEKYKRLTAELKYQFIMQSAHLIANLHNSGWLHNDIKPSNILLDGFFSNNVDHGCIAPRLLLADFALAHYIGEGSGEYFDREGRINPAGTAAYLAPERWQGQGDTKQSDIYAFGIMMYEILTATRPFNISKQSSEPLRDWAIEHCQTPVPALPQECQHYQSIINKLLTKRVGRRYRIMEEVLMDLKEV